MIDVATVGPIRRGEGLRLSRVQYARFADLLDALSPEEWAAPTDCAGWDVKAVASHVLGSLEDIRKPHGFVRRYQLARKEDGDWLDALNAVQVREHAAWEPGRIAAELRAVVKPALRMRARTPLLLRTVVRPTLPVAGRVPLSWIADVVYTRDTFLHRVDVCRATGREVVVDDVERRVIADIVREWAGRHGAPFVLRLTGPAGATYGSGTGGAEIACDAVDFARYVGGRGNPEGLLATPVQY
ncbi:MAG TPA: maleylpyruvate isomerase family mycothiol-dependent enzyme [Frankiaceae bacterium]|nr:maleylpyruvate isomerase family mycothiol-dependent enzyme [Frankiaceae bacterium]